MQAFYVFILFSTYFLAAGALSWIGRKAGVFASVRGLKWAATCLVFAPTLLAWIYGWILRLLPGHSARFYLLSTVVIVAPFALDEARHLLHKARHLSSSKEPDRSSGAVSQKLLALIFTLALALVFVSFLLTNIEIPVFANDPLEYFSVARMIFDNARLIGVYPPIDPEITSGFYGPWTHPPGFVLAIAWGYLVQGTAAYAGVAKLHNPFAMLSMVLFAFAWAGGFVRNRGVIAAALVLLTPLLMEETFDSHVDIARIGMWTATLCLLPAWFGSLTVRNSVALGVLAGFSMFIHSIGLIYWGLIVGLVVWVHAKSFVHRAVCAVVAFAVSLLIVAPDYIQNVRLFGRIIGDTVPLWEIKTLRIDAWLNQSRGLVGFADKLNKGLFAPFTKYDLFGPSLIMMAVAATAWIIIVCVATQKPFLATLLKFRRPTLVNVLLLSTVGFFGIVLLSVLAGSSLVVKNVRYLMTMTVVGAILVPLLGDRCLRCAGLAVESLVRINWRELVRSAYKSAWGQRRWIALTCCALALSYVAIASTLRGKIYRESLFPEASLKADAAESNRMLYCSRFSGFQLIAEINNAVRRRGSASDVKVMVFRPSDSFYYARFPIVSLFDPRLIPAFVAPGAADTYQILRKQGISHILVPNYQMGEIINSPFADLFADRSLTFLEDELADSKLYRLRGAPKLLDKQPILSLAKAGIAQVDLSSVHNLVTHRSLYRAADCDPALSVIQDGGESILRVTHQSIVLTRMRYEIDPTARYRMSFEVRSLGGTGAALDAGLATYDRNGKLLTDAPGEHRYGVAVNVGIPGDGRWRPLVGDFDGIGNENYSQFRIGTRYVSPVVIVNIAAGTTAEVRRIRLERIDN